MIIIIINAITLILLFPAFSYVILRHTTRRRTVDATDNKSLSRYQSSGSGDRDSNNNKNKKNNDNDNNKNKIFDDKCHYFNYKSKTSPTVIYGNKWEHWSQQQNNNDDNNNNNKYRKKNNKQQNQLPRLHSSPDYTSSSSSSTMSFSFNNNNNNINNSDSGFSDSTKDERKKKKVKVFNRKNFKQVNNNSNNNNNNNNNNKCYIMIQRLFDSYCNLLFKPFVKVLILLVFVLMVIFGIMGLQQIPLGLDISDVISTSSAEHHFYKTQSKHFGFYNLYVATLGDFDYSSPQGQSLLFSFHHSLSSYPDVIKNQDGHPEKFWLEAFRDWLLNMQTTFDREVRQGRIIKNGWLPNCTSDGRLAFKLIIQSGHHYEDKERWATNRLVSDGIINPASFYKLLTAWVNMDHVAYNVLQANIQPLPEAWVHQDNDLNTFIPASQPIKFAQSAFYLTNQRTSSDIIRSLKVIRDTCDEYTKLGLHTFPHGTMITFYEQYLHTYTWLCVVCVIIVFVFVCVSLFVLLSIPACLIATLTCACSSIEAMGLLGWMGVVGVVEFKLNGLSIIIITLSFVFFCHFHLRTMLVFQTTVGSRMTRIKRTLRYLIHPFIHSSIAPAIVLILLSDSQFEFIFKYFILPLLTSLFTHLFNTIITLPILLSVFAPPPDVSPLSSSQEYLPELEPHEKRKKKINNNKKIHKNKRKNKSINHHPPRPIHSLSTIAEESSISIEISPTIIITSNHKDDGCEGGSVSNNYSSDNKNNNNNTNNRSSNSNNNRYNSNNNDIVSNRIYDDDDDFEAYKQNKKMKNYKLSNQYYNLNNFIRGKIHYDDDDDSDDNDECDDDYNEHSMKNYKNDKGDYDTDDSYNDDDSEENDEGGDDSEDRGFYREDSVYPYRQNENNTQEKRQNKYNIIKNQQPKEKFKRTNNIKNNSNNNNSNNNTNNNKLYAEQHPPLLPRRNRVNNNNNNNNNNGGYNNNNNNNSDNNKNNNNQKENHKTKSRKTYGKKSHDLNDDNTNNNNINNNNTNNNNNNRNNIDINKKSKSTIVKATVHVTINNENNK